MWKTAKLGNILKTGAGGTPLKSQKNYYKGGEIKWLLSGAVCEKYIHDSKTHITKEGLANSYAKIFPSNTVLIAMYGATAGQVGILRTEAATNQAVCGIYPSNDCLPEFLYYYLTSYKEKLLLEVSGVAQPNLSQVKIKNIPLPLISLAEQHRIVAKLDAAFAEIDRAIEAAIAKEIEVEKLKASMLSASFSGDAVSWKTVKLEEICHKITDGSHNPPKGVEYSEYLMLSSKNIHNDLISYDKPRFLSKSNFEDENKRTDIQLGDVLLTIVGTIGRCAVFEGSGSRFTLQRSVAVLKPKHDLVMPRFMMLVMQNMLGVLNDGARGVAQKGIYLKSLKALSFSLPPLEEQQCIVAKLDAIFSELADANEAIKQSKMKYQALKSSILAQELQSKVV